MKPKKIIEFLKANFSQKNPLPIYIRGPPGVGKTSIVYKAMSELGFEVRTIIASTLEPVDVRGIPRITDKMITEWFPPGFFVVGEDQKVCYFFDELNAAPHSVQVCLPKGSYISIANKGIDELKVGDIVVDENGNLTNVVTPMSRQYNGEVIEIIPTGMLPIVLTPEHPILTVDRRYIHIEKEGMVWGTTTATFGKTYWKKAGEFKVGDFVLIPKIKGTIDTKYLDFSPFVKSNIIGIGKDVKIPLNEETAWLLGLYLAEGSGGVQLSIALNKHEIDIAKRTQEIVKKWFKYDPSIVMNKNDGGLRVKIGGSLPGRAFTTWFGKEAKYKKIPDFIMLHKDLNIVKSFLIGYCTGDGCFNRTNGVVIGTVSKELAQQVQLLMARFGLFMSINKRPPSEGRIRGRLFKSSGHYIIKSRYSEICKFFGYGTCTKSACIRKERACKYGWDIGDFIAVRVREVNKKEFNGTVYNIETSSNTYTVQNIVVHNCFYRIILEGKLDNLDISKCPRIGAGNRTTDRAIVNRMPSTLVTRFYNIEFEVDVDNWKEWAYANNINPKIISFINFRPELLVQQPYSDEKPHGCPRTYEYLSRVMEFIKEPDYEIVNGAVGEGVASEFMGFLRVFSQLPETADKILDNKIVNKEPSIQYALNGIVVDWFRKRKDISDADKLIEYAFAIVPEFSVKLMMDCAMTNGKLLARSKKFIEWSKKNKDIILPGGS